MDEALADDPDEHPDEPPALMQRKLAQQVFRWIPWLVLLLSLSFTGLAWRNALVAQAQYEQTQFDFQVRAVLTRIDQRMQTYQQILLSVRGLFEASKDVDRQKFRRFVDSLRLTEMYPGIQGLGFSRLIAPDELERHIDAVRREGFAGYTVQPAGPRDVYSSIIFLEPFSGRNLRAFGYDMHSEPVRRAAMVRARDSGEAALSGKVRLMQEAGREEQAGLLMYVPVYRNDAPQATPAERQAALLGWAYAPFRMRDLMNGIQGGRTGELDIEIYDGERPLPEALLYDSYRENLTSYAETHVSREHRLGASHTLTIAGHPWTVISRPAPGFLQHVKNRQQPVHTALLGLAISGMLFWLSWVLINGRRQALQAAHGMTRELRESEARFRLLADSVPALIWLSDTDRRFYWFNRPWLEFTGRSLDKEQGYGWTDGIHPEDIKRYLDTYYASFDQRQPYTIELRLRHHGGDWRWIADHGIPRFKNNDSNDEFIGYIGSCTDINERKLMEKALQRSEENFRRQSRTMAEILWGADVGTWEWNVQTGETSFNQRWAEIVGYRLEELAPINITTWHHLTHPDDLKRSNLMLQRCFRRELDAYECEVRMQHSDGHWVWVLDRGRVVEWAEDGQPLRMSGTHLDITARKQSEIRLQLAANVFTHAREAIVIADTDGTIIDVNEAFIRITGYAREEALGNNPRMLQSGLQDADFYDEFWETLLSKGHWSGEIWNRRKNGEVYPTLMTISAVRDANGRPQNYVALSTDITAIKNYQSKLEHIAHYDVLTGLPNRALLADRMRHALSQCLRRDDALAVVYLDLDGFKAVNDRHGHEVGDELLVHVARRMQEALREGDTLARIGGDEFIAVLIDLDEPSHCEPILDRLLQAAADPVDIRGYLLHVSVSIGITLFPADHTDADQLIRHADHAMYQAKQAGRNCYRFFSPNTEEPPET